MLATIYTTPNCKYCKELKEYLSVRGVGFDYVDVSANLEMRMEMIKISEQMGVPVMRLGNDVLIGFNKDKVEEVLRNNGF